MYRYALFDLAPGVRLRAVYRDISAALQSFIDLPGDRGTALVRIDDANGGELAVLTAKGADPGQLDRDAAFLDQARRAMAEA